MKMRLPLVTLTLAAVGIVVSPAVAADARKVELAVGYGFLHDTAILGESTSFPVGWTAGATYNLSPAFAIVGEFGASYKSESASEFGVTASADLDVLTFMGGPKFTARGFRRISPYVQALAGLARVSFGASIEGFGFSESASDSVSKFAIQPGGGVDIMLNEAISLRLGADYRRIFADEGTNEFRIVTGLTFGFGEPIAAR